MTRIRRGLLTELTLSAAHLSVADGASRCTWNSALAALIAFRLQQERLRNAPVSEIESARRWPVSSRIIVSSTASQNARPVGCSRARRAPNGRWQVDKGLRARLGILRSTPIWVQLHRPASLAARVGFTSSGMFSRGVVPRAFRNNSFKRTVSSDSFRIETRAGRLNGALQFLGESSAPKPGRNRW
jgi:hypothetical protein